MLFEFETLHRKIVNFDQSKYVLVTSSHFFRFEFGTPRWQTVLCLMAVWLTENLILFKGLKVYGKMAYFITLSPYVVLTAFIGYGSTLDGAMDGINHFLSADMDKLWVNCSLNFSPYKMNMYWPLSE